MKSISHTQRMLLDALRKEDFVIWPTGTWAAQGCDLRHSTHRNKIPTYYALPTTVQALLKRGLAEVTERSLVDGSPKRISIKKKQESAA